MFYYLNGELAYRDLNTCVIDCSGVGYKLTVSHITSQELGDSIGKRIKLFTHLAVREDGIELFGFGSDEERSCFNRLTSVSGVGPKVAMSILSVMTPTDLSIAICTENIKAIAKAPGIGSKTAARIVLELKDKISVDISIPDTSSMIGGAATKQIPKNSKNLAEATEALTVLGYDKNTIVNVLKDVDTSLDVGEMIRLALKKLSR
jgi:Holliday junction DNA helicase RuvA